MAVLGYAPDSLHVSPLPRDKEDPQVAVIWGRSSGGCSYQLYFLIVWRYMNNQWVFIDHKDLQTPTPEPPNPEQPSFNEDLESSLDEIIEKQRKLSSSGLRPGPPLSDQQTQSSHDPDFPKSSVGWTVAIVVVVAVVSAGYLLRPPAKH